MAIDAPTKLSDFAGFLTPEQSAPIFDEARRSSVVQQLVRRVPMGFKGVSIPFTTSKPVANWVGEGGQKPASKGGRSLLTMQPKKLAAIVVNSTEVVRADPGGYITGLRGDLAEAFAVAFDYAALHDLGGDGTGSGPFDHYIDETTKEVALGTNAAEDGGVYQDIVAGLSELVNDGKKLTGFALDDVTEPILLASVDANGRPIFVESVYTDTVPAARGGRLINRSAFMGQGVAHSDVVAYGGDWSKAAWGVVGGITYDVSDQATVTIDGELVSLWEHNLIAIRAEAEYGFLIADTDAFVKYTSELGS